MLAFSGMPDIKLKRKQGGDGPVIVNSKAITTKGPTDSTSIEVYCAWKDNTEITY